MRTEWFHRGDFTKDSSGLRWNVTDLILGITRPVPSRGDWSPSYLDKIRLINSPCVRSAGVSLRALEEPALRKRGGREQRGNWRGVGVGGGGGK